MKNVGYFKCDICGGEFTHLGGGDFVCPKCGNEILVGNPEDWSEEGDDDWGYTYEEVWGDKPECCKGCYGAYPDCRRMCSKIG